MDARNTTCAPALKVERPTSKPYLTPYIYPILTLPNEIVSEIFFQSLDPSDRLSSGPASPLFLGHICRDWRDIALSTPALWTAIELHLDSPRPREHQLELLKIWLNRSRDCPLSVAIYQGLAAGTRASARPFIEAISPHCRRCHTLNLVIPFCDAALIKGELPLLRTLAIGFTDIPRNTQPSPTWPAEAFHAPKLAVVLIPIGFSPTIPVLPWAQIGFLSIREVRVLSDLTDVLRSAPNLRYLSVETIYASDEDAAADILPVPPLIHLRTLNLTGDSDDPACTQILGKLTLPALSELRVSELCFELLNPIIPVRALLSRSGCHLPGLRIEVTDAVLVSAEFYRVSWPFVGEVVVQRFVPQAGTEEPAAGTDDEEEDVVEEGSGEDASDGNEGLSSPESDG
ncbi:hypothetical protein C8R44DRAFT_778146 [Mycena epipterygia]|nr:hypothetical protein C8R44DRAFT_778146 [Mycena epipterygia]